MAGKVYGKIVLDYCFMTAVFLTSPLFISESPLVISRSPLFISGSPHFILSYENNALPKMKQLQYGCYHEKTIWSWTTNEIQIVISRRFNCSVNVRQFIHVLARLQLYRQRKYVTDFDEVCDFIRNHLAILGQMHGYWFMHLNYITNGLVVNK